MLYNLAIMFLFATKGPLGPFKFTEYCKKYPEIPKIIMEHLVSRFTESVGAFNTTDTVSGLRKKTAIMQDRLISHIIVVCLHLANFKILVNPLAQDLGLAMPKFGATYLIFC